MLAHSDFNTPFFLSTDESMDGLGAVISQVPAAEERVRPVALQANPSVTAKPSTLHIGLNSWR